MSDRTIRDAIQKLAGTHNADRVFIANAQVQNVDIPSRTCTCTLIDGKRSNTITASLLPVVDDGLLFVPTEGSIVTVVFSDFIEPFVCQYSQLDKILFVVGNSSLQIIDGSTQFNAGSLGGLVKVVELTQKINAIENLLNNLITQYNLHTHTVPGGTSAPTTSQETNTINPLTQQSDIEDTTITH